jgi:hypothetical protein
MSSDTCSPDKHPNEVPDEAMRSRCDTAKRLQMVEEADKCAKLGEVGIWSDAKASTPLNLLGGVVNGMKAL